ncbi:MAG: tyrosine-type recombinase/integrase [Vulcanimicrobiaceae bacterium]
MRSHGIFVEHMFARLPARQDDREYRIRTERLSGGERFALIVDVSGLPVPLPNQWALLIRRPHVQFNTLKTDQRTIAHLYEWARRRSVDLDSRLATAKGLSPAELTALYQNLRYIRTFGRAAASDELADVTHAKTVIGETHSARVGTVRDYLVWAMERVLYRLEPGDARAREIRERISGIKRIAIEFQRPASDSRPARKGLTPDQLRRLIEIANPEHRQNPFQRPVRFRNMTLLILLLAFGFRRGESLKLYVSDVNVKGRRPSLTLIRRPDDPNDPRSEEPAVKTLGRVVYLGPGFARLLDAYIVHHRPQFPRSDESPFLFFSRSGKPLSLRMVNYICEQIISCFPEFDGILTPHVLRHTFNDLFIQSARESGLSDDAIRQAQNYANGWRLDSEQGAIYSRRTIEENAQAISIAHQRMLFA